MTDAARPATPAAALEAMRDTRDRLVDDHVRLFQAMPLRDRLEFLFRSLVQLSIHQVDHAAQIRLIGEELRYHRN